MPAANIYPRKRDKAVVRPASRVIEHGGNAIPGTMGKSEVGGLDVVEKDAVATKLV